MRLGIAYTFQITSVFRRLTVYDNVALAAQRTRRGPPELGTRTPSRGARPHGLDGPARADRRRRMSYGHQRLLEVAMGLALGRGC